MTQNGRNNGDGKAIAQQSEIHQQPRHTTITINKGVDKYETLMFSNPSLSRDDNPTRCSSDKNETLSVPLSQIPHPVATNEPRKHPNTCIQLQIAVSLHQYFYHIGLVLIAFVSLYVLG